uniref:Death domain-containing protein n=1 Tax=Amphimedon queenslandica TaxID=400682 RepID=A0A1X7TCL0_AMPQE
MATSQICLGVDDLVDVLDLLKRFGFPETKWHELGLRLGLRKNTLDVIEAKHRGDVPRCMTECLSQWLGRADNVDSRGGANLNSLSDALRSMNETAVAEKLKHQALINIFNNCPHTVLSQFLCDSVSIAWLLYAECMLTQEAVSRVVSAGPSIPNQREALLTAVKEAVQTDPNSLHTFANVLCTISTNVSLGQTILDDISKYFPTPEVGVIPKTLKDNTSIADKTKTTQSGTDTSPSVTSNLSSQPLSPQELSGVPAEYIYCTESQSFPVEMSCLDIENNLKWYSISSDTYSLGLYNYDGFVICYKDNRETMKDLTDKERSEIQEAEEA